MQAFYSRLDYLEAAGYDANSAANWVGTYYGQTPQFDDGYVTDASTSNERIGNKGRKDQKN